MDNSFGPNGFAIGSSRLSLSKSPSDTRRCRSGWRIESGDFSVHDGPGPSDPLGLLRELRVSDWVTADGELTQSGHKALARWLDQA